MCHVNGFRRARLVGFLLVIAGLPAALVKGAPPDRPTGSVHVLYVESWPRWEFRHHRGLLQDPLSRQNGFRGRVVLLGTEDASLPDDPARAAGLPIRGELDHFDLVVLGDIDPADKRLGPEYLKNLARFVKDGGGLVVIAGPHHIPHDLKGTALEPILPIELGTPPAKDKPDTERKEGYRPVPTPFGWQHPAFRLGTAATDSPDAVRKVWESLPEMYWWAEGYVARPKAEILATHPTAGGKELHPLMVSHKLGQGRCLFVGFDETWRWRRDDSDRHYRAFWLALWRSMVGR